MLLSVSLPYVWGRSQPRSTSVGSYGTAGCDAEADAYRGRAWISTGKVRPPAKPPWGGSPLTAHSEGWLGSPLCQSAVQMETHTGRGGACSAEVVAQMQGGPPYICRVQVFRNAQDHLAPPSQLRSTVCTRGDDRGQPDILPPTLHMVPNAAVALRRVGWVIVLDQSTGGVRHHTLNTTGNG